MIRTQRLILRAAQPDDLMPLHAIFSDPRAMRYWDRPAYDDIGPTQRFLNHFMTAPTTDREEYIIEYNGRCVGKAGMWRAWEVGYILHPDYWRKGIATEAMRAVMPNIWSRFPDQQNLTAECDPRNAGSIGLLTRLGFRKTGHEIQNFKWGDEWCDTAYYTAERPPPA